jgi:AbiEi antitoxin C-terminal domain
VPLDTLAHMKEAFVGSEAVNSGALTKYQLRSRFVALHPDVYIPPDTDLTAIRRSYAAWLWSKRRGVVAGQSAAALHGAKWVDARAPAELLYEQRRPPPGIRTWFDRVAEDESQLIAGVPATTPARTAFDLASRYPLAEAVAAIDALARATRLKTADAESIADRYKGHRNIRRARRALTLVDGGAESPRETWLRLLVIEAGYPPPQTQIPIYGPCGELVGIVDMGWENIKIALEYEGDHHWTSRWRFAKDIARYETMTTDLGWIAIRVTGADVPAGILRRLAAAWSRRTCHEGGKVA